MNNMFRLCCGAVAIATVPSLQGCIAIAVTSAVVGVATTAVSTAVDVTGAVVKGTVKAGGAVIDAATSDSKKDADAKKK